MPPATASLPKGILRTPAIKSAGTRPPSDAFAASFAAPKQPLPGAAKPPLPEAGNGGLPEAAKSALPALPGLPAPEAKPRPKPAAAAAPPPDAFGASFAVPKQPLPGGLPPGPAPEGKGRAALAKSFAPGAEERDREEKRPEKEAQPAQVTELLRTLDLQVRRALAEVGRPRRAGSGSGGSGGLAEAVAADLAAAEGLAERAAAARGGGLPAAERLAGRCRELAARTRAAGDPRAAAVLRGAPLDAEAQESRQRLLERLEAARAQLAGAQVRRCSLLCNCLACSSV